MNELLVIMIFYINELHIKLKDDEWTLTFRQTMFRMLGGSWILYSLMLNLKIILHFHIRYSILMYYIVFGFCRKKLLCDKHFHVYFTHRIYPTIKIIYSKFDKWQFWQIIWNRFRTNIQHILNTHFMTIYYSVLDALI